MHQNMVLRQAWWSAVAAVLAGALRLLTIVWPDRIERLTMWDPDQQSGSLEIFVVALLVLVTMALGALSLFLFRRLASDTGANYSWQSPADSLTASDPAHQQCQWPSALQRR